MEKSHTRNKPFSNIDRDLISNIKINYQIDTYTQPYIIYLALSSNWRQLLKKAQTDNIVILKFETTRKELEALLFNYINGDYMYSFLEI